MYGWFLVVVTVLANAEVSGVALDKYYVYDECDHADARRYGSGRARRGRIGPLRTWDGAGHV